MAARSRRSRSPLVILDAALTVAARDGLGGATLGRVAEQAGTSKASIVYHFGSLQGLRRAMAERVRERLADLVLAGAQRGKTLDERVKAIFDDLFSEENRDLQLAVREVMQAGARDKMIADQMRSNIEHGIGVTGSVISGSDEERMRELSFLSVATVQGFVDFWLALGDPDPTPYREGAEKAVRAIVAALAPEVPQGDSESDS